MDHPSIITHIKGETVSKRPPLGKLGLAGKRIRERQLLDREQRERDRRDLLSLVGKNSSLVCGDSIVIVSPALCLCH